MRMTLNCDWTQLRSSQFVCNYETSINTPSSWNAFKSSTFLQRRISRYRNACWLTRLVTTFSAFCLPSNRTISSSSPDKAMGVPLRRIVRGKWRVVQVVMLHFLVRIAWLLRYLVRQYLSPPPFGCLATVCSVEMDGRLMMNWKITWKEGVVAWYRYCPLFAWRNWGSPRKKPSVGIGRVPADIPMGHLPITSL